MPNVKDSTLSIPGARYDLTSCRGDLGLLVRGAGGGRGRGTVRADLLGSRMREIVWGIAALFAGVNGVFLLDYVAGYFR